ncbi:MAG TPA: adenine phosphoribosyltransferase [Fastidiosipila sp.]|nr:adenine phosphoribosyltransferase [Fastidiosipila sp.]
MNLKEHLRYIPGFPEEGVTFIDITTVLKDPILFHAAISELAKAVEDLEFDVIVGAESRGFIMGAPLAYALGKGFIPVRKKGKLPAETVSADYELEYGKNTLEIHTDSIKPGMKALIVDDLLATGGTAKANCELVEALGGVVSGLLFFIELDFLKGMKKLDGYDVRVVLTL